MLLLSEFVKERQNQLAAQGFQPKKFILQAILTDSDLLKGADRAKGLKMRPRKPHELLNYLAEAADLDPKEHDRETDSAPEFIEDLPFIYAPSEITESAPADPPEGDACEVDRSGEGASEVELSELPAESLLKLTANLLTL